MSVVRAPCPTCGKESAADTSAPLPPSFPFCCERCRLIDLGQWFDEEFRISRPAGPQRHGGPGEPAAD